MKQIPRAVLRTVGFYLVFALAVPFSILEGAFRLLPVSYPPYLMPVTAKDPVVHFQANVDYLYSSGWDFAIQARKHSNNFGYINVSDYRRTGDSPLLVAIGDSFVEAHMVDEGKSAPEVLSAGLQGAGRVYSVGVSGAQLSEYLVFAEYASKTFHPNAMAFVIIGNDFDESLLKYRSDPRLHYFDSQGHLQRVDYELGAAKKLLRHSALVRYVMLNLMAEPRVEEIRSRLAHAPTPTDTLERIPDSEKAVDWFFDQLPAKSGLDARSILFVLDGVRPALYSEATWEEAKGGYHARMRRYFAEQARARGYEVLDMQPAFVERHRRDGSRFEFPTDGHWNALGHAVAADEIRKSAVFARCFGSQRASSPGAVRPLGLLDPTRHVTSLAHSR